MKFSCPKCAAKYHIADEKVKGRTVKMKCRKCGTTIPIRAAGGPKTPIATAASVHADSLRPQPAPRAGGTGPLKRAPSPAAPARPGGRGQAAVTPKAREEAPAPNIAGAPRAEEFEWHAGIGGQAVGPMSVREIERRIGDSEITEETYFWRDGMDGWKPIGEVSELKPILMRSLRPMGAPPPSMPAPAKAQAPVPGVAVPAPGASPLSSRTSPVASEPVINEAPVPEGWGAAMEGLGGDEKLPAAAAIPSGQGAGVDAQAGPAPEAPIPHIDMPEDGHAGRRHSYDSIVMQLQKKRTNPLAVPFAVVAALVFGVTVGFVLFGDQETKIVRQIVEVPAKVGEAIEHQRGVKLPPEPKPKPSVVEEKDAPKEAGTAAIPKSGAKTQETSTPSAGEKPAEVKGLTGLQGLDGLGGPTAGPSGPTASTEGGRPLSSSQIQSTVSQYRTSVKRGCWERALMMRDKDAPSSARVSVSIKVAASGNVMSASSSGDPKGYSGLSSCITQRVQGWKFPRGSGITTVNVPFVFAAQ